MIRLTRAPSLLLAQHWLNLLQQAEISCVLHNQHLQGALGDIPVDQCGPEIWLDQEADRDRALALIRAGEQAAAPGATVWSCATCDERQEPQFSACWRCGAQRPV